MKRTQKHSFEKGMLGLYASMKEHDRLQKDWIEKKRKRKV